MTTYRNSTLIEVVISTCLHYLRSYYPNLGHAHLSPAEIRGNREVQLMSIDILSVLVTELILVVRDNGKGYATYISDLFSRCKVQKVVLHSLLAGVNDLKRRHKKKDAEMSTRVVSFTEDILSFNEVNSCEGEDSLSLEKISNFSEASQVQLLRLLLSLVMLEQVISQRRGTQDKYDSSSQTSSSSFKTTTDSSSGIYLQLCVIHVYYIYTLFQVTC